MAALLRSNTRALQPILGRPTFPQLSCLRCLTKSAERRDFNERWFHKKRKIEPVRESHSSMLSDKRFIYVLHTHNIRPDSYDKYLANYTENVQYIDTHKGDLNLEFIGSWSVEVGDLDQALHLWQYNGGFQTIIKAHDFFANDQSYQKLLKERNNYLRSRLVEYLLAFSYWPPIVKRDGSNIYEIRRYSLDPGTMIEWGNNWAKAINFRLSNNEAFAGFFSHIGRLYNVHHFWCYKDLQSRKETRESAWQKPGWDQCVSYTVPLIRDMHSCILRPLPFSPTK